jgi:hypothetical protein
MSSFFKATTNTAIDIQQLSPEKVLLEAERIVSERLSNLRTNDESMNELLLSFTAFYNKPTMTDKIRAKTKQQLNELLAELQEDLNYTKTYVSRTNLLTIPIPDDIIDYIKISNPDTVVSQTLQIMVAKTTYLDADPSCLVITRYNAHCIASSSEYGAEMFDLLTTVYDHVEQDKQTDAITNLRNSHEFALVARSAIKDMIGYLIGYDNAEV